MAKEKELPSRLSDEQLEVADQLYDAATVAKKLFGTDQPTPEMIFGVFDRLDGLDFDDEDEE